jgi:hypothetical protein
MMLIDALFELSFSGSVVGHVVPSVEAPSRSLG